MFRIINAIFAHVMSFKSRELWTALLSLFKPFHPSLAFSI